MEDPAIINDAVCFDTPKPIREEWREQYGVNFTENEWLNHTQRVNKILHVAEVTEDELNRNNKMLREK